MDALAGQNPCVHGSRQSGDIARDRCLLLLHSGHQAMALEPPLLVLVLIERPEHKVEVVARQIIQKELHLHDGAAAIVICRFFLDDMGADRVHHLGDDEQRVRPRRASEVSSHHRRRAPSPNPNGRQRLERLSDGLVELGPCLHYRLPLRKNNITARSMK